MKQGIDVVLNAISFDEHITDADLLLQVKAKLIVRRYREKHHLALRKWRRKKESQSFLFQVRWMKKVRDLLTPIFNEFMQLQTERFHQKSRLNMQVII